MEDTCCYTALQSLPCSTSLYNNGPLRCEMSTYNRVKIEPGTHYPSNGYMPPMQLERYSENSCRQTQCQYSGHDLPLDCLRQDNSTNYYPDGASSCSKMSPHFSSGSPPVSAYPSQSGYNNSMPSSLSCVFGMQRPKKVIKGNVFESVKNQSFGAGSCVCMYMCMYCTTIYFLPFIP